MHPFFGQKADHSFGHQTVRATSVATCRAEMSSHSSSGTTHHPQPPQPTTPAIWPQPHPQKCSFLSQWHITLVAHKIKSSAQVSHMAVVAGTHGARVIQSFLLSCGLFAKWWGSNAYGKFTDAIWLSFRTTPPSRNDTWWIFRASCASGIADDEPRE